MQVCYSEQYSTNEMHETLDFPLSTVGDKVLNVIIIQWDATKTDWKIQNIEQSIPGCVCHVGFVKHYPNPEIKTVKLTVNIGSSSETIEILNPYFLQSAEVADTSVLPGVLFYQYQRFSLLKPIEDALDLRAETLCVLINDKLKIIKH